MCILCPSGGFNLVVFSQVREDPGDFTGWTYLLQHVDSKNDLEAGRYLSTRVLSVVNNIDDQGGLR